MPIVNRTEGENPNLNMRNNPSSETEIPLNNSSELVKILGVTNLTRTDSGPINSALGMGA